MNFHELPSDEFIFMVSSVHFQSKQMALLNYTVIQGHAKSLEVA